MPRCPHTMRFTSGNGRPVCADCGHVFPAPKPSADATPERRVWLYKPQSVGKTEATMRSVSRALALAETPPPILRPHDQADQVRHIHAPRAGLKP